MLLAYASNAQILHRLGSDTNIFGLLSEAVRRQLSPEELNDLSADRQRIIREVSRLSRAADFRQRVLFAYGHRCAVSRVQLQLVDAAHILPVGAPGSSDHVRNGIALSPTYHRAFDAGLIYLDEQFRMHFSCVHCNGSLGNGFSYLQILFKGLNQSSFGGRISFAISKTQRHK